MSGERFISREQLQLISESEAKFLLEHAEKQLKDILDTNLLIVNRTTTLLTLTLGLIIGLVGFSINRFGNNNIDELFFTSISGATYLFYAVLKMGRNFTPTSYMTVGAEPKLFFTDKVFNAQNEKFRLKQIYVNEILEYQRRIETNKETNERRWIIFNSSVKLLKFTPLVLVGVYVIATIISSRLSC